METSASAWVRLPETDRRADLFSGGLMQSHLHLSGLTREQVHFSCKQRCTTQASLTLSPPICLGPWGRGGKPKGARGPEACPRPRSSICPEYSATCTFVGIAASLLLVGWVQSRLGGGPRQPSSHSLCKLTGTRASGVGHLSSTPQPRLFFGFPANKASRVLCGGLTLGTGPILGGWVGSPALHKETRALPGVGDKGGWPAPACAGSEGQILQAGCPHPLPWSVRGGEVGGGGTRREDVIVGLRGPRLPQPPAPRLHGPLPSLSGCAVDRRGAWGRQASMLLMARLCVPITPSERVSWRKAGALEPQPPQPCAGSWAPPSQGLDPVVLSSPALCSGPCVGPSGD